MHVEDYKKLEVFSSCGMAFLKMYYSPKLCSKQYKIAQNEKKNTMIGKQSTLHRSPGKREPYPGTYSHLVQTPAY